MNNKLDNDNYLQKMIGVLNKHTYMVIHIWSQKFQS